MNWNKRIPLIFTLFGATGDLTVKKIMPALIDLFQKHKLPPAFTIIAFSRRPWSDDEYRTFIRPLFSEKNYSAETIEKFLKHVHYIQGILDDKSAYESLRQKIEKIDSHIKAFDKTIETQKIYYLAVQPEYYVNVITGLSDVLLNKTDDVMFLPRLMIEKPIGRDLSTAQELEILLASQFAERQKYRIDHYLGKEGMQAIITERKKLTDLDYRLNSQYVESIYVRIWESAGIGDRGEFYDSNGALRDVGQNHVLEILATATLDIPRLETAEHMAHARAAIIRSLKTVDAASIAKRVARGQYKGYKKEKGVNPKSAAETYFRITTEIQTPRWKGVEVTMEAGKAMPQRLADITFVFKDKTKKIFDIQKWISPDKPSAHEILIEKAIHGDHSMFVSSEEVIASWKFMTPILQNVDKVPLTIYNKMNKGDMPFNYYVEFNPYDRNSS